MTAPSPRDRDGRTRHAVVVGGGLAGIAAALRLADRGHQVVVVERAAVLGGLCRSVEDPVAGRVDTGQHVFLGCCTSLERLLRRLRARPAVRQRRLELTVAAAPGARTLRTQALPSPLHLAQSLARWPGLGTRDRLRAARLGLHVSRLDQAALAGLDGVPCLGWLQAHGQSEAACTWLWEPILVATCNVPLANCSAGLAAFVIREGLMRGPEAGALRIPATDLTRWLDQPARTALTQAGVELRLRWRAIGVEDGGERLRVLGGPAASQSEPLLTDSVVLAVPARQVRRLAPPALQGDPTLSAAAQLPDSPIVNLHLFCDRPILPAAVVVAPDSPLQWCFDRTALAGGSTPSGSGPFHVAVSLSAAGSWAALPGDEVAARLWSACQRVFPAARRARLLHHRVTREAHATFAAVPGSARARPGPATAHPGIALAGSWTATGWPATMEGAVRSGEAAAQVVHAAGLRPAGWATETAAGPLPS
ncbi:MAG TPA: hydroxysqualene dehydroxylase HpnE [Verrucomicrobiae bacterium]|nr:hydroxysqualene dehydroxylase HpnE [Verrucomicrobiae bacterium]